MLALLALIFIGIVALGAIGFAFVLIGVVCFYSLPNSAWANATRAFLRTPLALALMYMCLAGVLLGVNCVNQHYDFRDKSGRITATTDSRGFPLTFAFQQHSPFNGALVDDEFSTDYLMLDVFLALGILTGTRLVLGILFPLRKNLDGGRRSTRP
jgi:hypothetical protein